MAIELNDRHIQTHPDDTFDKAVRRFMTKLQHVRGKCGRDVMFGMSLGPWDTFGDELDWLDTKWSNEQRRGEREGLPHPNKTD